MTSLSKSLPAPNAFDRTEATGKIVFDSTFKVLATVKVPNDAAEPLVGNQPNTRAPTVTAPKNPTPIPSHKVRPNVSPTDDHHDPGLTVGVVQVLDLGP